MKFLRQSAILAWTRATFSFALRRLLEPFCVLANRRWYWANRAAYWAVWRGLPDAKPSEVTTTSLIPTSIPTVEFTTGSNAVASSTSRDTKYRPAGSRETVTVVGLPVKRRDQRMFSGSACFASLRDSPSHLKAEVVYSADWTPSFFLKRGQLARPWKKLRYAVCKRRNDCCKGTLDTSLSHVHSASFFHSVNNAELCG